MVWGAGAWWWGPVEVCQDPVQSSALFFRRLATLDYNGPNSPGSYAQAVQKSAYPDRYDQRMDEALAYFNRLNGGTTMGWTGDPTWLEEVLRADLGDRLIVEPGWENRGTGNGVNGTNQMGNIWGVMIHHTGNDRETVEHIRDGRPDLAGPLSQCLITPDGKCHLIAIGPCNHAGIGSYPGIPTNQGNQHLIGFECAWPTIRADGSYDPNQKWPDAQVITMRDATAAVLRKLGYRSDRVIGHKEYAGASQGKWDPGNMDMGWFRAEVQKDLDGYKFPGEGEQPEPEQPADPKPTPTKRFPQDWSERELLVEILRQLRGPTLNGWPQLRNRTLVDAVAWLTEEVEQTEE